MQETKIKLKSPKCNCSGNCADTPKKSEVEAASGCCSQQPIEPPKTEAPWITGRIKTSAGWIPQVSTTLGRSDVLGSWKARWGIGRMNYKVNPGLYCVGRPDSTSPVLVSANYKMSFDRLRSELKDINAWILVLNTKGINVWCAAGKGTYGTEELVDRIGKSSLAQVVSHRTVIAAQLGAPGIAAHEVQKRTGFKVVYGPVRAEDLPQFLQSGMKATAAMRKVKFTLMDRLVLTPMEFVGSIKPTLLLLGVLFLLNLTGIKPFGLTDFYGYLGAVIIGGVITPLLLPWVPFRAFALKGWVLGLLWALSVNLLNGWPEMPQYSWVRAFAYLLILPAVSAYGAMNFTGCSTYTSPSGVNHEMKKAIPAMIISLVLGIVLILIDSIFKI